MSLPALDLDGPRSPVPPSLLEVYESVAEPDPIGEDYVDELLGLFKAKALDLVYLACFAMREGRSLVPIADVVDDALRAVEASAQSLRS